MKTGIPLLLEMLTYRRPAFSTTDELFCQRFIEPTGARPDAFGNYLLRIGSRDVADDPPRVAWCAHTDTVHRLPGRQRLSIRKGIVRAPPGQGSNCLGADDTTGVWLLLEMIRANVPGLYIFHRAEEKGCQGSDYIARETPEVLGGIDYAIAFDRRGYDSVVTHQVGARTASDAFAWSLAAQLPPGMSPDDSGVYTDTERYAGLVAECTNVSVGYDCAHSATEWQDLDFAKQLRDAMVRIDPSGFACERVPAPPVYACGTADYWDDELPVEPDDQGGSREDCACCGRTVGQAYLFAGEFVCRPCFDELFE